MSKRLSLIMHYPLCLVLVVLAYSERQAIQSHFNLKIPAGSITFNVSTLTLLFTSNSLAVSNLNYFTFCLPVEVNDFASSDVSETDGCSPSKDLIRISECFCSLQIWRLLDTGGGSLSTLTPGGRAL